MYKRRLKVFLGIIGAAMVLLAGRIAHLQIVRGERYRDEFQRLMRRVDLLPAARGQITDRAGRILAADVPCMDFCLDYRFLTDDPVWTSRQVGIVRGATGASPAEANEAFRERRDHTWRLAAQLAQDANADLAGKIDRILERVRRIRQGVQRRGAPGPLRVREEQESHPIAPGLMGDAAVRVADEIRSGRTVGAVLRPGHRRSYPYGESACHLIGVTGPVGAADLERRNVFPEGTDWLTARREGYEADDSLGIAGVEKMCESLLRGRRGYRLLETGGREPVEVEGDPPRGGLDVHTTLDIRLQEALERRLRETGHNGAAVVLSVANGDVLASASVPTYDLNRYREDFARLRDDSLDLPLLNRAAAGRYPPGSSAKPIVALAGLATGRLTPATTVECGGYLFQSGSWQGKCTGVHGTVDLHRAILKSCNIYFFRLGQRLTLPVLCEWFRLFGLHERVGAGLPEEKAGHVPSAAWIAEASHRAGLLAEAMQEAIGQGVLLVTPLHMANAMATIARDGSFLSPMLVLEGGGERKRLDLPLAALALQEVRQGMRAVVNTPDGTGYAAFHPAGAGPLGVEVCGKTGTAQVEAQRADIDRDGRVERDEVVREGKMAWFVGFAPADHPRIAFAVALEYVTEGTGGSNAGPVALDLVRWCRQLGYLNE